jgi:hypothetical protein
MKFKEIYIVEQSWIAKFAAWKLEAESCAIVIWDTIYLHKATAQELKQNTSWYKHELVHIQQWKQHGFLKFLFLYLFYSAKYGYYNNPFEIEAREGEDNYEF